MNGMASSFMTLRFGAHHDRHPPAHEAVVRVAPVAARATGILEWRAPRGGYSALPVAWGVSLLADPGMTIGRSIQTTGIYDLAVTEVLARLIQAGEPWSMRALILATWPPLRRLLRGRTDTCWRGSRIQASSTCSSGTWRGWPQAAKWPDHVEECGLGK